MSAVQAVVGTSSDEYCIAVGTELQQQGNRLRFTLHRQSDVQSLRLELLAQMKDVVNRQMFALNLVVFLT